MADLTAMYDEADRLKDEGKYDEAIKKLNGVLAEDEHYTLAHLALAVLFGRVGKHEDAVQHAQKACELEPEEPFNFTAASVTYQRLCRHSKPRLHPPGGRCHGQSQRAPVSSAQVIRPAHSRSPSGQCLPGSDQQISRPIDVIFGREPADAQSYRALSHFGMKADRAERV